MKELFFVTIGRNEGERLKRCIESILTFCMKVVYVDSGSTDGSVEWARAKGCHVHELDSSRPFNMARARNAGFALGKKLWPECRFVHFLDGDCELLQDWAENALTFLKQHPEVAAVCGRRLEKYPENSVYNRMCDIEWNTPLGETRATGGDAIFRTETFEKVGGFNEELIAGEEPELCLRIRLQGGKIWRLPQDMSLHDANLLRFSQWWRRQMRGGFAAYDVWWRTNQLTQGKHALFADKIRSPILWITIYFLFLFAFILLSFLSVFLGLTILGILFVIILLQAIKIAVGIRSRARKFSWALEYGFLTLLAKIPQILGIIRAFLQLRKKQPAQIIEYK